MKKYVISLIIASLVTFSACKKDKNTDTIVFGTSADYPPFEYRESGKIIGFEIDLVHLITKELGTKAVFQDMQFSTILPALANKQIDAGVSTITITPERQKNFDFSDPYHFGTLATVFKTSTPVTETSQLIGEKIGCQLGTTMEIWLKKQVPEKDIILFDNNNLAIEALKAGHIDVVLIDGAQASAFTKKNSGLSDAIIAKSDDAYAIAFKKGSPLKEKINHALKILIKKGEIKKLEQKWLEGSSQWKD